MKQFRKVIVPEISVIMPVYNAELYLDDSIKSVLSQDFENFEFIIINDGSSDHTCSIVEKYMQKDSRIHLITRKNKGLIYSLNEGISRARGKFIARIDSDDICLKNRFEFQLAFMKKQSLDICGGHFIMINENNKILDSRLTTINHEICFLSLFFKVPFPHSAEMIRKGFLDKHELRYGQSIVNCAEDLDLWIRMFNKGAKFGNVDEFIIQYRVLKNSLSRINNIFIKNETKILLDTFSKNNIQKASSIFNKIDFTKTFNSEEESIITRIFFRALLKNFKYIGIKKIKNFSKRNVLNSLISELLNVK